MYNRIIEKSKQNDIDILVKTFKLKITQKPHFYDLQYLISIRCIKACVY